MLWRKNGSKSSALLVLMVVLAGPSICLGGGESRNVLKATYLASAFSVRFQEGPGVSQPSERQRLKVRYSKVGTYRTLARG